MTRFTLVFGIVLVMGLTLVSGVIHGWMSNRWGASEEVLAAASKLEEFPERFGNWQSQSSQEMSENTLTTLECAGYFVRAYANQETGETVKVAVIVGPSGPTAVHTPEICYSSRAYTIREDPQPVTVQNSEDSDEEFWRLTFQSNDLDGDLLRVYYAWSSGGPWSAAENPRLAYAGYPYLYKIQLAANLPPGVNPEASDPCVGFLRDFVPVAKRYLVVPSGD